MATSIVKIYDRNLGQWSEGTKVVLGWNGVVSLGMSKPFYTGKDGRAEIEHTATGNAEVYINGKHMGYMETPGSASFEIE